LGVGDAAAADQRGASWAEREDDAVGSRAQLLLKLAQLARFGLTSGQPLFRGAKRHA
jgi:hypothetical protein